MPNPKKPQALRELHGTANRNKHRDNDSQPTPTRGIGPAPKHLNELEAAAWDEIVGNLYVGVLGEGDKFALETLARLVVEMRTNFELMPAAKLTQMINLFGRFGMTPSDRTKIVVPKQKETNPFERFK